MPFLHITVKIIFFYRPTALGSYENLELNPVINDSEEGKSPKLNRMSVHKLVRQSSVLDTQKDCDGAMKITYWF